MDRNEALKTRAQTKTGNTMKYLLLAVTFIFSSLALADVTLTWTAPTPVLGAEVVGYNIEYGDRSGVYTDTILISDATKISHVTSLPDGDTYFTMNAFDASGRVSPNSNEVACAIVNGVCSGPNSVGGLIVN